MWHACMCLSLLLTEYVWGRFVIKKCVCFYCLFKVVCGGLDPRCRENMFWCHMGLVGTWLNSLWQALPRKRERTCSNVGPGLFHTVCISNSNSCWIDLICLVNIAIEPMDGKGNKNKVLYCASTVQSFVLWYCCVSHGIEEGHLQFADFILD